MPTASIVISTYNRASLLGQAIHSALAQSFTDLELIVVDDGSTDQTREVIASLADPRLRYTYQRNAGLGAGRNAGLRRAQAEYIAFLDDDDLYLPDKLALQVAFMDAHPDVGWTSTGFHIVDMDGHLLRERRPWLHHPELDVRTWLFACPTCPSAVVLRRGWLERVGGFDEQRLAEDWDLWLRLALAGCRMAWVREVQCLYRMHTSSITGDSSAIRDQAYNLRVLEKFYAQEGLSPDVRALQKPAYAHQLLANAAGCFRQNEIDVALDNVARALEMDSNLAQDHGQRALDALLNYAVSHPLISDPYAYANKVLGLLPERPFAARVRRRQLLGQVAAKLFFRSAGQEDRPGVRRAFGRMLRYDLSWLCSRGMWSIVAEAIVGKRVSGGLRTLWRSVRRLRGGNGQGAIS